MSSMKDRENAFENKFAHDSELKFKAEARRNKLLGLWAAELLGKTGEEAEAYAKAVVLSDFEEAGDEDVFRKVRGDFDANNVDQSDHQLRRKMDELMAVAVEQIQSKLIRPDLIFKAASGLSGAAFCWIEARGHPRRAGA